MTLNGVMAVTLRYFTEFGNVPTHYRRVDVWRNLWTSLLYFVLRIRCRCKESSRSLTHLLMFLVYVCFQSPEGDTHPCPPPVRPSMTAHASFIQAPLRGIPPKFPVSPPEKISRVWNYAPRCKHFLHIRSTFFWKKFASFARNYVNM